MKDQPSPNRPSQACPSQDHPSQDRQSQACPSQDSLSVAVPNNTHSDGVLPRHLAVIMDGNGRWAKKRLLPVAMGHRQGFKRMREMLNWLIEVHVPVVSVFAFSRENWQRPQEEVDALMGLLREACSHKERQQYVDKGIRVRFIGERTAFAPDIQALLADVERSSSAGEAIQLNIAVNYSGQWDILQAAQKVQLSATQALEADDFDKFSAALSLGDLPPIDLLIRTGNEMRISNFFLWQLAYAELFFSELLWPDFTQAELTRTLAAFVKRGRRFGRRV